MTDATSDGPALVELVVADASAGWMAAGFSVGPDNVVRLGSTAVRLVGATAAGDGVRGITGWTLRGVDVEAGHLDGLRTQVAGPDTSVERADEFAGSAGSDPSDGRRRPPPAHPNGATGIDHVVVSTPDLERTIAACEAAGLHCRRIREAGTPEAPLRQAFFRLGPTILEVVGGAESSRSDAEQHPARWFGLALDVADLDATATLLGGGVGQIKGAVQRGRRIATLRHRQLGLSVAVALMDDHGDR